MPPGPTPPSRFTLGNLVPCLPGANKKTDRSTDNAADARPEGEKSAAQHPSAGSNIATQLRKAVKKVGKRLHKKPVTYVTREFIKRAIAQSAQPPGKFWQADYIPALGNVTPENPGATLIDPETGKMVSGGAAEEPFSAQSTTKFYRAAQLIMIGGLDALKATVGSEASGEPFNSDKTLPNEPHKPPNPFVNIGAIAVSNRVEELVDELSRQDESRTQNDPQYDWLSLMKELTGNDALEIDTHVAKSEDSTGHNNRNLAEKLSTEREQLKEEFPNARVLPEMNPVTAARKYHDQCATKMSTEDHAKALWNLMYGTNPRTGKPYLTSEEMSYLRSLKIIGGLYDQAGGAMQKTRGRVNMKSGVGGAIIGYLEVPGQKPIPFCTRDPRLNTSGNSKQGLALARIFSKHNLRFPDSHPLKRAAQKVSDKAFVGVKELKEKISPKEMSDRLMRKMGSEDQTKLKQRVFEEMTRKLGEDGGEKFEKKVNARSEYGYFLKVAKPGQKPEDILKGKILLVAPGQDGVMRTYVMDVGHNMAKDKDGNDEIFGGAKIVVFETPDAIPTEVVEEPEYFTPPSRSSR